MQNLGGKTKSIMVFLAKWSIACILPDSVSLASIRRPGNLATTVKWSIPDSVSLAVNPNCLLYVVENLSNDNADGNENRAYGTRPRSSQNCAIVSILCPIAGNGAFLCVNDVVYVHLHCRKDAIKVFFREVNTNKYTIITVLTSSYTLFQNTRQNSPKYKAKVQNS